MALFVESRQSDKETGLTSNQNRLLYLIGLHTRKTESREEKGKWIRKQALSVLLYEAIIADIFDYDYAPHSTLVDNHRVWVNTSQEGQSDIEFLREEELIGALILSSSSYKTGICYQISDRGKELLSHIPRGEKEIVDQFAYRTGTRELLKVLWSNNSYWLQSPSGFTKKSSVTETEDVSYVSSAYIPQCLRYGGRPTMSNAHKAYTSGFGAADNIRDQNLDEVVTLSSISIIVAEYIPFGSNQIVQLNSSVGATERVQGGFVSSSIDNDPCGTTVDISPELTSVEILDYTLTNHINFEAEIRFTEDYGIVQVETFGMSLNAEGTCFYGMQIEAVMDRVKDKISLDHLARILVDVQQDSSKIVDSILSQRQRDLLNLMFMGDAPNRNKINLIIANEINPHLTAEEYMDKGAFENELQQIIGATQAAYDITEKDTLIFGVNGLLVCGPHSRTYEPLLCAYMQYVTLDIFLQNFCARMWMLSDRLQASSVLISSINFNPTAFVNVSDKLCTFSQEIMNLNEILGYIFEALQIMEVPPEPSEQAGRSLYQRLELSGTRGQLIRRTTDVQKNVDVLKAHIQLLRDRTSAASETRAIQLHENVEQNVKTLCALHSSNVETVNLLKISLIIFSGMISFDFLDRITGDWTVLGTNWMKNFAEAMITDNAYIWFIVSIGTWMITAFTVTKIYQYMNCRMKAVTTIYARVNSPICINKMHELVENKVKLTEERKYYRNKVIVTLIYQEKDAKDWGGTVPTISLEYDEINHYLLQIIVQHNNSKVVSGQIFTSDELKDKIIGDLKHNKVFTS